MVPPKASVRVAQMPTAAPRVPAMSETIAETATTSPRPTRGAGAGRGPSGSIGGATGAGRVWMTAWLPGSRHGSEGASGFHQAEDRCQSGGGPGGGAPVAARGCSVP